MLPVIAQKLNMEENNKEGWLSGLCDIILERQQENGIELHVAYPVGERKTENATVIQTEKGKLYAYGFYEDVNHAECYDAALEAELQRIISLVSPDVIHCFGTEFAHSLAVARCYEHPERLLIGIQGVCQTIAERYMADLPEEVQNRLTFRDWLKKDSIKQQQQKFVLRGIREAEILSLTGNVTGRTDFDRSYVAQCNEKAEYYCMNETLRACFYEGCWDGADCEPHTIFVSQGDYPLKGLHYLLLAAGDLKKDYPDLQIRVAGNSLVNYDTVKDKIKISAYGKYLRELIDANGLSGCIRFLGKMPAEEMKRQYLNCGLYVCCSANENSPNSLGEAMLLGVPCVAARVGGIPSLFEHGVDGILYDVPTGVKKHKNNTCNEIKSVDEHGCDSAGAAETDAEENVETSKLECVAQNLNNAIREMWENEEKMMYYCQNARKHARITHDKERNYNRMTEIYAKIASKGMER